MHGLNRTRVAAAILLLLGSTPPAPGSDGLREAPVIAESIGEVPDEKATPSAVAPTGAMRQPNYSLASQGLLPEAEPNNVAADATPLGGDDVVAIGDVFPNADVDFWSFTAGAGDRVYAAAMTSFSASASTDSVLELIDVDGVTVLETDLDDGSFGTLSSSIAGTVLPTAGTYYLRVRHNSATGQLRPYHLHFRLQTGSPVAETEPNDGTATANALPASGWVSGDLSSAADQDWYSIALNAGDTLYVALDLDPERDTVEWNGQLGIAIFGGFILTISDAGTATPDSEAHFMTVQDTGTYFVRVNVPTGGTTFGTYQMSVSVAPAQEEGTNCTTYTSTDVPVVIPTGPGIASSTLTVPGNPRIADLDVSIELDHTFMQDLDVHLVSPAGNDNGLFTDVGNGTAGGYAFMDVTFDDEAGIPPSYTVLDDANIQPELNYRLSWFDGEDAGGTWTLVIRDDRAGDGGNLTAWSLRVCEPEPEPVCAPGTAPVTVYQSDFEADDGGFTHSGTADEWERGLPAFGTLTTCNSGSNCWVTDLDNTYNASSSQDLLSPSIDLTGLLGPVVVTWNQRYQIESASFDHFSVDVQEVGGANPTRLFEWLGATMTNTVGNPTTTVQESAGWGRFQARADAYAGAPMELRFHLDSDTTVQFPGVAIDDVTVTACEVSATPEITLEKTVGTVSGACAATDDITIDIGTPVTYCYTVTNTGNVTLTSHTLVDDQLGVLLEDEPLELEPGESAVVTVDDVLLTATTVNTATWTATDDVVTTSCSAGGITITGASGSPYPSTVTVAGAPTSADLITISLEGLSHTFTSDIDALLVGPAGGNLIVLSDVSGGQDNQGIDLLLTDSAAAALPGTGPLSSGAFRPADYIAKADDFPAPAPAPPYASPEPTGTDTLTSEFGGADPNGTWNLYVTDAFPTSDDGSIDGWCLSATQFGSNSASDSDSATVTVLIPDISVDPTSLSSTQLPGVQTVLPLDIDNGGDGTLDWEIVEAEPIASEDRPQPLGGPVFYSDRGTFDADVPGLPIEGFENTLVPPNNVVSCDGPFNSATNDACFAPGAILPGISLDNSVAGQQMVVLTAGFLGAPSVIVGPNTFTDELDITFPGGDVSAVGLDLQMNVAGNVDITVFGVGGVVIGSQTIAVSTIGDPIFWGVVTGEPIESLHIVSPDGNGELVDDVAFGASSPCVNSTDVPWLSVDTTTGTTPPLGSSTVQVTLDSTGLVAGTYEALLCFLSNDPDTPRLEVPVSLEVEDTMPFLADFEEGDLSEWSSSQP